MRYPGTERAADFAGTKPLAPKSIIHVGGVGTNALINSALLAERGYVSHVAANDIYHCVCSPEWAALATQGLRREDLGDDFFPNFFCIAEAIEVRPGWFAQGPQLLTITYLHQLKCGNHQSAAILWRTLQYNRFKAVLNRTTVPSAVRLDLRQFEAALVDLRVAPVFKPELRAAFDADQLVVRFTDRAALLNNGMDPGLLVPPFTAAYVDAYAQGDDRLVADIAAARRAGLAVALGLEQLEWSLRPVPGPPEIATDLKPSRQVSLEPADIDLFGSIMPAWNCLFSHYDQRITYGGSAVLGLLSDATDYLAYEHGTIRSLPFENSSLGRLTRAAYEQADAVFLTNTDYAVATRRLEFEAEKRTYVPHAFDERPLIKYAETHRPQQRRPGPIRLFGPARQDWILHDPARSKANHLVVEAAAELVACNETNFEITFVAWGDDVEHTKKLILEKGVDRHFSWIEPLARNALWQRYLDSDAVLDQFLISGLSGVSYETLALACRTITKDDGICNREFFGVPPPFLAAGTSSEIADRIRQLIADPQDLQAIGAASQQWVRDYHSGARFVALQEAQFSRVAAQRTTDMPAPPAERDFWASAREQASRATAYGKRLGIRTGRVELSSMRRFLLRR